MTGCCDVPSEHEQREEKLYFIYQSYFSVYHRLNNTSIIKSMVCTVSSTNAHL